MFTFCVLGDFSSLVSHARRLVIEIMLFHAQDYDHLCSSVRWKYCWMSTGPDQGSPGPVRQQPTAAAVVVAAAAAAALALSAWHNLEQKPLLTLLVTFHPQFWVLFFLTWYEWIPTTHSLLTYLHTLLKYISLLLLMKQNFLIQALTLLQLL